MPPNNSQLAQLQQRLSAHDLTQFLSPNADVIENPSDSVGRRIPTDQSPLNVVEFSSRASAKNKPAAISVTGTVAPNDGGNKQSVADYWYWPAEQKQDECFSAAEMERKLQIDAARRIEDEKIAESTSYWTWESPVQENSRAKEEEKQIDYWSWNDNEEKDVLSTDHIVENLVSSSDNDTDCIDQERCETNHTSDDYWSWENPKRRRERIEGNRTAPQHLLLVDEIEARLVEDSMNPKGETLDAEQSRESLTSTDIYWKWDTSLISHSRVMKNATKDILATDVMIERIVEAAQTIRASVKAQKVSDLQSYWQWSDTTDVLSGAAIEHQIVQQMERNQLVHDSNEFWSWEGMESSFEAANTPKIDKSRTFLCIDSSEQYWIM